MLLKSNTQKVFTRFFEHPQKTFGLRELSRLSNISTTAAKKALQELVKENMIKKLKVKPPVYQANSDYAKFKESKKVYTLNILNESGLIDYIDEHLHRPEVIILFGSSARGEDIEKSDIDIFVLVSEKLDIDLLNFEKILKRNITLMQMTKEEFKRAKRKSPELINNIANGIIIKGYLEVI